MKKLIAIATLMFAFTVNSNAQDKKAPTMSVNEVKIQPEVAAKKDAAQLAEYLNLDGKQTADFYRLFEMKHKTFQDKNLSKERKTEMSKIIGSKIRASLDGSQIEKLEKNEELFNQLIN